jgi:hypothetical protein
MQKLWVFGHSACTNYNSPNSESWPSILAKKIGYSLINQSYPASDNLVIFTNIIESNHKIKADDLVIVGWSHPSRKTFVLNKDNPHQQACLTRSMKINTSTRTFIRSEGTYGDANANIDFWKKMVPVKKSIEYYDDWYDKYFDIDEQRINFKAYLNATELLLNGKNYIPFYFSKESVKDVLSENKSNNLYWLEYLQSNKRYTVGNPSHHFNSEGHRQWANIIFDKLNA